MLIHLKKLCLRRLTHCGTLAQVEKFIAPLIDAGEISILKVKDGFF